MVVDAINAAIESALSGLDVVQSNINLAAPTGILLFGLITGLRHSMEADHVAAVLSIVASDRKGIKKASLLGAAWGIGHTASLFVSGLVVLTLAINIPESVSSKFEFVVGVMLILLAATAFTGFDIGRFSEGCFVETGIATSTATSILCIRTSTCMKDRTRTATSRSW